jgi:hypothetical protein
MSALRAAARVKPNKLRDREVEEVRESDPDGRIVYHHRTVDTLDKMLRAGTIDQAMHNAAKDFQAAFIIAQLDPLRALPIAAGKPKKLALTAALRKLVVINVMLRDATPWRAPQSASPLKTVADPIAEH